MDLYLVTGPFYLFNALNLKLMENWKRPGVLVIAECFGNARRYYEACRERRLFEDVELISEADYRCADRQNLYLDQPCKLTLGVVKTLNLRFPGMRNRQFEGYRFMRRTYERIFAAGVIPAFYYAVSQQLQRHGAKLYYFDSGLAVRAKATQWSKTRWQSIREKLGCTYLENSVQGRYFYSPELVCIPLPYPMLRQRAPQCDQKELCSTLKAVYSYEESADELKEHRFLYLHGGYEVYPQLAAYAPVDVRAARLLADVQPDALIKAHPVSGERFEHAYDPGVPFEISSLFLDMEDKVLIAGFSVALLNPMFLYHQQPWLILLYRVFSMPTELFMNMPEEEFLRVLHKMLPYDDPSRIIIPGTWEEYEAAVRRLARTAQ